MGSTWLLLCVGVLLVAERAFGFDGKTHKFRPYIMGRPFHGFVPSPITSEEREEFDVEGDVIEQPLDHFNSSDSRRWKQHYYYNLTHYEEGGPIFLMLGGEGPEDGSFLIGEHMIIMAWARRLHAAVYDIEHRFYGYSRPLPDLSAESLKYLNSRQALADAANLIQEMNKAHGYKNPRWVVFGGSYSGALALWFRQLYPELVVGAVGSSAPVQATLDFHEYLEVVEASLRSYSSECADEISDGFDKMTSLIWTPEGRQELDEVFTLDPTLNSSLLRYKDIQTFFATIYGNFQGAVQYSRINAGLYRTAGGIPDVCAIMTNTSISSALDRLAAVNVYMTEFYTNFNESFESTNIDYDAQMKWLQNSNYTYPDDPEHDATRSWVWQTCTEFAYFQSTDQGYNIFKDVTPISYDIEFCTDLFGPDFNVSRIDDAVRRTNRYYGGRDRFKATNVVMPNGDVDPWHALGKYDPSDLSAVPYLIHGTAHCADMYNTWEGDVQGLNVSRQIAEEQIRMWVGEVLSTPETTKAAVTEKPTLPPKRMEMKKFQPAVMTWPVRNLREKLRSRDAEPRSNRRMMFGRPIDGFVPEPDAPVEVDDNQPWLEEGLILQPVDQFNSSDTAVYNQRFWVNTHYYKPGGPLFLFIEGESPAGLKWVTNDDVKVMKSAQKFNAAVFMLEHRYYGDSRPTVNQSTENLMWLSSRQALADLARFVEAMNLRGGYQNPQWVSFGGSYSGMLSAWLRQLYPELIAGAVASSAPIEAKVDFYEYMMVTANSLKWYSPNCSEYVRQAFEQLHTLVLTPSGRASLSDLFKFDPPWKNTSVVTDRDVAYVIDNIVGNFAAAVQYNNDNTGLHANGGGIKEVCERMITDGLTPLERLADVNVYIFEYYNPGENFTSTDNDYETNTVEFLKDVTFGPNSAARSWTYQTCTEFGFFQATDSGNSIFGSPTPVNLDINVCADVFGSDFTSKSIYDAVEATQKFYGGKEHFTGTNVIFINGAIDPWHALGEYTPSDTVATRLMDDTAHCADMYPPRVSESSQLAPVRQAIDDHIAKWIGYVPSTTGLPTPSSTAAHPSSTASSTAAHPSSTAAHPPSTAAHPSSTAAHPPSTAAQPSSQSSKNADRTSPHPDQKKSVPATVAHFNVALAALFVLFLLL